MARNLIDRWLAFFVDEEEFAGNISPAELRARLNRVVLDGLRPIAAVLGLLMLVWAYTHHHEANAIPLISLALVNAGLFFAFALLRPRWEIPPARANLIAAVMAALVLGHRLVSIRLNDALFQSNNLMLLIVGVGFIVLSTPWMVGIVGGILVSWTALVIPRFGVAPWQAFAMEMASATALALILHGARLRSLRRQIVLQIQNEARTTDLKRQALQLETLIAVGQSINAVLDLDALLNHVVDLVQDRFGYYYAGIFLLDELDEEERYVVSRAGAGEIGRQLTAEGFRLRVGEEGLIGWVAEHREAACVNDVRQDARYVGSESVPDTRAELVLPLEVSDDFLGVLDLQSDRQGAFTPSDVAVFQSLADQVAIAIQNATLYQRERKRRALNETLNEVSRALSQTLDRQQVLDLILVKLNQIVPFDRGSVMLKSGAYADIVAAYGFPPESDPLNIHVPLTEDDVFYQIKAARAPLVVPEVLARPDWYQVEGLPQARVWMGTPLIDADDQVIGMLSLTRETPAPYSEDEVSLAQAFAGQAAVALQNARLYSELSRAYDQLDRLDRTKSDFINVAAHELRTPLTVLRAFSQMMVKDPDIAEDPTKHRMAEGMHENALRLHSIVDSMVDMARIDSRALKVHAAKISLPRLIHGVVTDLAEAFEKRKLVLEIAPLDVLPEIEVDPDLLSKVIRNLLLNAIKYTPDGGTISVGGQQIAPAASELDAPGVEIIVSDTGIGIETEYQDLIFAKFYQTGEVALHSSGETKFKGGGPGLGLAIAKGIVEAHQGRIWVESPGYDEDACPGSDFHVILPVQQRSEEVGA